MQEDKNKEKNQGHDVDEHNRVEVEKTPPGSFTGTNIDRYVAGETSQPPETEIKKSGNNSPEENK